MPFVAEAMEVLGGIGYCEESELPRLYREMPVNSIWEGSGNIMCLNVLRVLTKQPSIYDMLSEAFAEVKGQDRHYDRRVRQLQQRLRKPSEELGREITQQLFLLGCGAQMLRYASPPVAQAWCQMMLDTRGGLRLSEQVLNDLLLRATGDYGNNMPDGDAGAPYHAYIQCRPDKFTPSGNLLSIEYGLYAPVVGLLVFVHLNDPIP